MAICFNLIMKIFPFNVKVCVCDLHLRDSLNIFRSTLRNAAGVYGFQNKITGEIVYIGSAINLWRRLIQHLNNEKSNPILQHAFSKYGVASFRFLVFFLDPLQLEKPGRTYLVGVEQIYLDFFNPRYNILRNADSSLGYKHSPETLAKISGENNPLFGRTEDKNPIFGRSGSLHPRFGLTGALAPNFGKVPANAVPVYVYDLQGNLIKEFSSQASAAQ